jgi:hypothetical protein
VAKRLSRQVLPTWLSPRSNLRVRAKGYTNFIIRSYGLSSDLGVVVVGD